MQLARASAGTGRKGLGRLSIRALTGSERSGGKVIDESCRNEKKGRAQGTEVGEKALVPNVATVSCGRDSRLQEALVQSEHVTNTLRRVSLRGSDQMPPLLPWARAEAGGWLVGRGRAGTAGVTPTS